MLRFLTCGSVDDGKSTLIGHLLRLTGNLYDDQLRVLEMESARPGAAPGELDYSLLLDGLLAEREQGITIDVAYRYFETSSRKFVVADTPGHERYTRNMATGASHCAAAVLLIDAQQGVLPQTRRHALICSLLGIGHLLFAVNKMDKCGWDRELFDHVKKQCRDLARDLRRFGFPSSDEVAVPVSALLGDNLVEHSPHMPWYEGPTVIHWLESVSPRDGLRQAPLRLPVQYVIKGGAKDGWQPGVKGSSTGLFRAYAGNVVSGRLRRGDDIVILPGATETRVGALWNAEREVDEAEAGMAVSVTLEGEHDVARGDLITLARDRAELGHLFKTQLVWMSSEPLYAGRTYLYRGVCGTAIAEVTRIRNRIELTSYHRLASRHLDLNDVGEAEISLNHPIPFDPYRENRETGSFILIDRISNATVACGMILHPMRRGNNLHWQRPDVTRQERAEMKGQRSCVIWFTGLSGSGKSAIANALERKLLGLGKHCMLLDGDNIRQGLNRDLGFSEADRVENIRRIGEVARLMADAGLIVITAFISPFKAERELVRRLLPEGEFVEVHVSTSLEECARRDPKGLYAKAGRGEIPNFTGITSRYEVPENPEVRIDTERCTPSDCAEGIIAYLVERGVL